MNLEPFLYLAVILIIVAVIKAATDKNKPTKSEYRYKLQPYLLTKAELSFYLNLRRQLPKEYGISCKVRLADILKPAEQGKRYRPAFSRISAKHLDFVLYEYRTGKVVSAIELDDKSHQKTSRKNRDDFLNAAAEDAGLQLHRVVNKKAWSREDIAALIPGAVVEEASASAPSAVPSDQA